MLPRVPGNAIEIRDVCFTYGGQEVLHNVSCEIPLGAFVAVVGPNGGGKTTLLKLVLGERSPRFGAVRVLGGTPQTARRRLGYVPQALPFDADFPVNVRDVVLMGRVDRRPIGPYRREDRRAADAALERVGLRGFCRRPFGALSGGERQRVLIAQALVSSPELLLLDEPTANVDAGAALRLHALFDDLKRDRTIVMVSHNTGAVTGHATHVLCVNHTANLHTMAEVAAGRAGEEWTLLLHGPECHVLDPSAVFDTPHTGAPEEDSPA